MEISLKKIEKASRYVLENLFYYYIYDMSEYMEWAPNEEGKFAYNPSFFDAYWEVDDHIPYFIYVGAELAGFALIRRYPSDTSTYDIAQFFVLRKFKGKGVGKKTLALIVKSFPGKWQIRVLTENSGALNFWQSAVSNIVGDAYTLSKDVDVDLLMHFIRFEG
ncbi:MAG: putative acetyltransferase [Paraglaciecola sp.]|jgi:predicted acetyltransferase